MSMKQLLKLATVIRLADPGAKDEGGTRQENHVVEVHRALNREVASSPYLAHHLLVFDDRQLVMGVPGTMFRGLRCTKNLMVTQGNDDLY